MPDWKPEIRKRLAGLRLEPTRENEIVEELTQHLDDRFEELRASGATVDEATCAALAELSDSQLLGQQLRQVERKRAPEPIILGAGRRNMIADIFQDLRYAFRMLRKNPGFTAVAVISLALGIGGNAAMFSLVNRALIQPLPYSEPDKLARVSGWYPKGAVVALQQRSKTMEFAAFTPDSEFNLTGQGEAAHLVGSSVSANLFSMLGAQPEIGRTFMPGEDQPGQDQLVIISYALWQSRFAADSDIIGRPVTINGVARQVVGVMPDGFGFPSSDIQLWTPIHLDPTNKGEFWEYGWMLVLARLRPEATIEQAQSEIPILSSQIIPLFPYAMPANWNDRAIVTLLQETMVDDIRGKLLVLLGAVGFVLLIACANVASLLLARTAARQREITIRAALGAGRGRIVRQLLTESVVLAFVGGGLGLVLAFGGLAVLKSVLPMDNAQLAKAGIDWQVLAFATALAILTGLIFGLTPALSATRLNLAESLKTRGQQSMSRGGIRLRSGLIVSEVALAVVLVIGAGLLIKSLWRLTQVDPGFQPEQLVTVRVFPDKTLTRERAAGIALYDEALRRARRLPGVSDVAAANTLPFSREVPNIPVELEDHPLAPSENLAPLLWAGAVTPDYFQVMRIPLLGGRTFLEADGEKSSKIVLVSASTAKQYWPGEDAIGKRIRLVWEEEWRTIVGVVGDVRQYDLAGNSPKGIQGAFYMPYSQSSGTDRQLPASMTLILRTTISPSLIAGDIRNLVASLNPNVPISEVRTLRSIISAATSQPRAMMWLFVSFAGSALILAAVGTYGVVSYSTAQRTHEMGVRVALGATKGSIFNLVLGQSFRLVIMGLVVGLAAALALTQMMASLLYGVEATDPMIFAGVGLLLIVIAALAGYFPARRAATVDPMVALRYE